VDIKNFQPLYFQVLFSQKKPRGEFLRVKAATALARLSHRNSVHLSVCHTDESVQNGAS